MADVPPPPGANKEKIAQLNKGADSLLPEIPYLTPPVDPRELPGWYEKHHELWRKWRDESNRIIAGRTIT